MMSATFKFVEIVYQFVFVFESISHQLTNQEQQHLEWYCTIYIENFFPDHTTTVLHLAIVDFKTKLQSILMLEFKADPNAIDEKERTPLHILAPEGRFYFEEIVSLFKTPANAVVNSLAVFKGKVSIRNFFNCHTLSNIGLIDSLN
jgi:hypothetical protein